MFANSCTFWRAFRSRKDLKTYENNALLLFALQIKFGIEDIILAAENSLTDGISDKKTDLVYIDGEEKRAIIAQGYMSKQTKKACAPSNKASDLNTAISWLLSGDVNKLPTVLKTHAEELRRTIKEGKIQDLQIWYVHNLPESKPVREELKTVRNTAHSLLSSHFPENKIDIQVLEVGTETLEDWYRSLQTPILVTNEFNIPTTGGFSISSSDWSTYITTIPAHYLQSLFKNYGTDLLSSNVREYLGSRKADNNINYGIKNTVSLDPEHLLVFNNGITVLVNEFEPITSKTLKVKGFSIINGSQTTGVIGNLKKIPDKKALIQVRFIMCVNHKTVTKIVKYNNSQNKMTPADFRSNDRIQRRLLKEFGEIPDVKYMPRRGGAQDVIRRIPDALPSVTAGQALAAFHGDPDVAYHQKTKLWEDNDLYDRYFRGDTNAPHVVLAYSLLKAIENKKRKLRSKLQDLAEQERIELDFFRKRGSIFMLMAAISACLEIILNKPITSKFSLRFKDNLSPDQGMNLWSPIVEVSSSFSDKLSFGLSDGFRAKEKVDEAISTFRGLINSTKQSNKSLYSIFSNNIILS